MIHATRSRSLGSPTRPVLSFAVLPLLVPALQAQQQFHVEVTSDIGFPVGGAPVAVRVDGGPMQGLVTDSEGATQAVLGSQESIYEVRIGETATKRGSTVGQTFDFAPFASLGEADYAHVNFFQPEARRQTFDHFLDHAYDTDISDWWSITPVLTTSYLFDAEVANLLHSDIVEAYFRFHGQPMTTPYEKGLLIRMDHDVELGSGGMLLALRVTGTRLAQPAAEGLLFAPHADTAGHDVSVIGRDGDVVLIRITGWLLKGDNLVLVYEGPYVPPSTRAFAAVPGVHGGGTLQSENKPCEPEPPDDSTCQVPPDTEVTPPSHDCGLEEVSTTDSTRIKKAWSGPPPCAPGGSEISGNVAWEVSGGYSIGATIHVGMFGELTVEANGRVSKQVRASFTLMECWCAGNWTCEWKRTKRYRKCVHLHEFAFKWPPWTIREHWMTVWREVAGEKPIDQVTTCEADFEGCGARK